VSLLFGNFAYTVLQLAEIGLRCKSVLLILLVYHLFIAQANNLEKVDFARCLFSIHGKTLVPTPHLCLSLFAILSWRFID